ncbi:MAG: EAL domain-containing protein [Lachnospiraceae bacterium]|nr:EAL domain-containing protein [Lachnospiraceae bacterium]
MERKRIALLCGQADEAYQREFISGVMEKAFEADMDVCVFSMFIKYQNSKTREKGDSNIFSLINYNMFDGVIIMADTIQTPRLMEKLERRIHDAYKGPVVCVDRESEYFQSFWTDGYKAVYDMTTHIIEHHGITDIAYLTGRANHRHSQRRLAAFQKCMEDHYLPIGDNRIFYGDFWYTSGASCAEKLLRDKAGLPKAVMCANDCMAIGLADELTKNGIRIPEDIAVVGYGTSAEGQNSPKSLTSVYIPAKEYGVFSVQSILNEIAGEYIGVCDFEPHLYLGESCGCNREHGNSARRASWTTNDSDEGFYSIHNTLSADLIHQENMAEFLTEVYENIYYLPDVKRFDICLNDLWKKDRGPKLGKFPKDGYSEQILWAIGYDADHPNDGQIGLDKTFAKEDLLPEMNTEKPNGYIFTPLFVEDFSFGYTCISFGDKPVSYEEVYRLWIAELVVGLEMMRRLLRTRELERRMELLESGNKKAGTILEDGRKVAEKLLADMNRLSGQLNKAELETAETVEDILDNNKFIYHFQPIVSAKDGQVVSYEALMRSNTAKKVGPLEILHYAEMMDRLQDVERATFFNVLAIIEEKTAIFENKRVFINSISGCRLSEEDNDKLQEAVLSHPGMVVVEMTEQTELSDERLDALKAAFRRLGVGMAVDDYGTGYSNVSNLLRYMPDVVKIDRSLLSEIQNSSQKEHFVRDIIEFCHANDILALAEGVETAEELRAVILLGADLIQGYYTARPAEEILLQIDESIRQEIVRFHREYEDGTNEREYIAGSVSRISVNQLIRKHRSRIVIGAKDATFRDVTIVGTPGLEQMINIEVLDGYEGRVTLENVTLANARMHPCIRLGDNCNLTLRLVGSNKLHEGGILVPETSRLNVEGEGSLSMKVDGNGGYGIGAEADKRHGELSFYQDGEIRMEVGGRNMVGIGSGLGGQIYINRGKYDISMSGENVVGIGAIDTDTNLFIHTCDLLAAVNGSNSVCIGSLKKNVEINIEYSKIQVRAEGGRSVVGIGTVEGKEFSLSAREMAFVIDVTSNLGCGLGALNGATEIYIDYTTVRFNGSGREIYVFGGVTETDTKVVLNDAETDIELRTTDGAILRAPKEQMQVDQGRYRANYNMQLEVKGQ